MPRCLLPSLLAAATLTRVVVLCCPVHTEALLACCRPPWKAGGKRLLAGSRSLAERGCCVPINRHTGGLSAALANFNMAQLHIRDQDYEVRCRLLPV